MFLETLAGLERLLRESGDARLADEARGLSLKLSERCFQVVVMGEFKRGKSTLINALIGRPLLPVAAVPLTSVVTVVRHGADTKAYVEYQDGHRQETAIGSIVDYVSEDRNPRNEKRVERVVVETPAPFLADGTLLVDTPGAGSVYRHNTEAAQKYMPEADAVILVLSADPPIGQAEIEFLHSVRRWVRKLFIVQNKTDYLEPDDLRNSLAFTKKTLDEALPEPLPPLIPVSAKLALQGRMESASPKLAASGLPALEEHLRSFLATDKSRVLAESVAARAAALIDRTILGIDLRLRAARASVEEWQALSAKLRARLDEAKRREFELTTLYSAELKGHEKAVEARLYERVRELSSKADARMGAFYRSIKSESASAVRQKLNESFMRQVEDAFSTLLEKEELLWNSEFEAITDRYLSSTLGLVNETLRESGKALGVPASEVSRPILEIAPPSVWFVVEGVSVWSGGIGSIPTLRLLKPFFFKAIRRKLAEAMDLNAGRLRYDHLRRLEDAGAQASRMIQGFFDDCLAGLQSAVAASVSREAGATESTRADVETLQRRRASLAILRREFPIP